MTMTTLERPRAELCKLRQSGFALVQYECEYEYEYNPATDKLSCYNTGTSKYVDSPIWHEQRPSRADFNSVNLETLDL